MTDVDTQLGLSALHACVAWLAVITASSSFPAGAGSFRCAIRHRRRGRQLALGLFIPAMNVEGILLRPPTEPVGSGWVPDEPFPFHAPSC